MRGKKRVLVIPAVCLAVVIVFISIKTGLDKEKSILPGLDECTEVNIYEIKEIPDTDSVDYDCSGKETEELKTLLKSRKAVKGTSEELKKKPQYILSFYTDTEEELMTMAVYQNKVYWGEFILEDSQQIINWIESVISK